jgi:hypothetical protein
VQCDSNGLTVRIVFALFFAFLTLAMPAHCERIFDVAKLAEDGSSTVFEGTPVVADRSAISAELPDRQKGSVVLDLDGFGNGPQFYWSLFTLENSLAEPRDIVLSLAHRGFVSSGLFQPSHTGSLIINSASSLPGRKLSVISGPREDLISLHLEPGQTVTAAVQGLEPLPSAEIWTASSYEQRQSRLSGLHGAILGIGVLLTLGIALLAVLRNSWFACAALVFACSTLLFLAQELGLTQSAFSHVSSASLDRDQLRAVVESLLCAGFTVALIALSGTNSATPVLRNLLWALVGLAILNIGLLFFNPALATGFARIGMGFIAIEGLLILLRANRNGIAASHALPFWIALTAWTAFAAFSMLVVKSAIPVFTIILLLGACGLLAYLGFVVLENLFVGPDTYAEDDEDDSEGLFDRSSLALAGARHYMWEWSTASNEIETPPEFWESLGYAEQDRSFAQQAFFDQVHPDDIGELLEKTGAIIGSDMRDVRIKTADGH